MTASDGLLIIAISLALTILAIAWGLWEARRRTPPGVIKRLAKTGAHHTVGTGRIRRLGIWNPARPFAVGTMLWTRGTGTYTLDGDGLVHLHWRPHGGPAQELVGPVPERLRPASPQRRTARPVLGRVGAVYLAVSVAGFLIGLLASSGSVQGRVLFGLLGLFIGFWLIWLVALFVSAARAAQRR